MTRQIEPEWDDNTRGQAEALARYLAEVCECGLHKSVLDDYANRHMTFDERYCPACAAIARYARVVADRDDKDTPKDAHGSPAWNSPRDKRPDDGRHIFVREMTPAEVEERKGGAHGGSPGKRSSRR